MSREREIARFKAVELVHAECGRTIGAASPVKVSNAGRTVTVDSMSVEPRVEPRGVPHLACERCRKLVPLGDGVERAGALLAEALTITRRGYETREDGRRVGRLRVALSG